MADTKIIAVLGAGLMGHGIALTFANAGHDVRVYDPLPSSLEVLPGRVLASLEAMGYTRPEIDATLSRITAKAGLPACVSGADFVFEAAPEKPDLKRSLFKEVERHAPATAILASNTSVIPITTIMADLDDGTRALGTHWWNPPHMIPLVEVIRTQRTAQSTIDKTMALLESVGKTPVRVDKDVAGFIGNRLQHALWREAIYLVESGVCTAEAVDVVVNASFGRRLSVLGPLANADLVGTDLTLDIHENVLADLDNRPEPSPYLRRLVEEGKLGMKSGEGFRSWTPKDMEDVRQRVATHLRKLETILED
ncbi:probable 3-hydroxybutyryl-CoA dehydrogenase FadB3 [Stappia aggregata IAM 12614]|uniref:Probable 3-hydroxybutyryl-CoA dehydrogenase FadB3 n=1 Tax=Roseibium aggregatum (strain ATCC 25650 / DSM 13394 / JCM 20685 / NBRC 16684 / NCIMB 2208 / IAM 12614 / B1) TaxID=384765 RepID=A0P129_ROSAI|nr:3-hydroxyacyl-CoA dehydrogenase family protein [Roseibium aggregatum]EAV41214.1 probable 3-hydroxybutyryl-CoA dehydrogenase FadB3 [Stappia aggregata IAM 12614] [Roseibium aggregatum IAM 12614]